MHEVREHGVLTTQVDAGLLAALAQSTGENVLAGFDAPGRWTQPAIAIPGLVSTEHQDLAVFTPEQDVGCDERCIPPACAGGRDGRSRGVAGETTPSRCAMWRSASAGPPAISTIGTAAASITSDSSSRTSVGVLCTPLRGLPPVIPM